MMRRFTRKLLVGAALGTAALAAQAAAHIVDITWLPDGRFAHKAQVAHDLVGKEANYAAVVSFPGCGQDGGMRHLIRGDVLKHNFPLLFI